MLFAEKRNALIGQMARQLAIQIFKLLLRAQCVVLVWHEMFLSCRGSTDHCTTVEFATTYAHHEFVAPKQCVSWASCHKVQNAASLAYE